MRMRPEPTRTAVTPTSISTSIWASQPAKAADAAERHRHEQRDTEAKDHDGFQRRHHLEQGKRWTGIFEQRAFQHFGLGFGDVEGHDAEIGRIEEGEGGDRRPHRWIEQECAVRSADRRTISASEKIGPMPSARPVRIATAITISTIGPS